MTEYTKLTNEAPDLLHNLRTEQAGLPGLCPASSIAQNFSLLKWMIEVCLPSLQITESYEGLQGH